MKTVLVDSNIFIDLFGGIRDAAPKLAEADRIFISPLVLGEVRAGFGESRKDLARKAILDDFLSLPYVEIVPVSDTTAEYYAGLFRYLKRIGRKIPDNDLWIASQALEHGTVLLTRDAHFSGIPNLRVWGPDMAEETGDAGEQPEKRRTGP